MPNIVRVHDGADERRLSNFRFDSGLQAEAIPVAAQRSKTKTGALYIFFALPAALLGAEHLRDREIGALSQARLTTAALLSDRPVPPRQAGPNPVLSAPYLAPPLHSMEVDAEAASSNLVSADPDEASAPPSRDEFAIAEAPEIDTDPVPAVPAASPIAAPPDVRPDPHTAEIIRSAREKAEERRRIGDIFGMRLFLERAARLGSHEAQVSLAQTYDARYLAAWGVRGVRPDPALAAALYEEAEESATRARRE